MIWEYKEFKKYFDSKFWKAFNKVLPIYYINTDKEKIVANLYDDIKTKNYYPSIPKDIFYINKGNWVIRKTPLFEIKDYLLYFYCIKSIEDKVAINKVEWTYWGWSFSWKMRSMEEIEKLTNITNYIFKESRKKALLILSWLESTWLQFAALSSVSMPSSSLNPFWWIKAYGDFNSNILLNLHSWEYTELVEFDIANFYDNIRLDILENKIKSIVWEEYFEEVSLLFHFLNYWNRSDNFYNKQSVWLPQDVLSECSRILANFYLQDYDIYVKKICDEYDVKYLRYADDQIIFWNDKNILKEVMFLCTKKLWEEGLNVNQKKVSFYSVYEFYKYKAFDIFDLMADSKSFYDVNMIEKISDKVIKIFKTWESKLYVKKWLPLLNRSLKLKFSLLWNTKRNEFKKLLLNEEYIVWCNSYQLKQIFNSLLKTWKEKNKFLRMLDDIAERCIFNNFHNNVRIFFFNMGYSTWVVNINKRMWELNDNLYNK